jgi:hypothetical protein
VNYLTLLTTFATVAILAAAGTSTSHAAAVIGGPIIVATTGKVTATFQGQTAGFDSIVFLDSPGGPIDIFHNHISPVGTTFDLGTFTAGTELVFGLRVLTTGITYYSGDAARNPDGIFHNLVDENLIPGAIFVGFEDIYGGGDSDYDDNNFSLSLTTTDVNTVPETGATLPLLVGVLGMMGAAVRSFGRRQS